MPANKCNGLVTSNLAGIASMIEYAHEDGSVCARPGPRGIPVGSLVESTYAVILGLCEHSIEAVHEFTEPEPQVTVQNIVQAATAKTKPVIEDAPVSADIIERAKVPPKIRVDLSTSPALAQAAARLPVEQRFDGDLEGYSQEEIEEVTRGSQTEVESSGAGEPLNPFSSNFDPRPSAPARKRNKPVNVF